MNTLFTSYIYIYLNPLCTGEFSCGRLKFNYEPFYVGKGSNRGRIDVHLHSKAGNNNHKKNLIAKIKRNGLEPIRFKLYEGITECSANRLEKYYIAKIGRADMRKGPLTNMTDGGEGSLGYKHSAESIERIKESIKLNWEKGKYVHIDISGNKNPFYQKTHADDNKLKFAMKAKETFSNRKQSDEHINKKANAIKGDKNGMYGKNILNVWIEKYGEDEAKLKYERYITDNRRGQNNSQYGKKGKNHAAAKTRILVCPLGTETLFDDVVNLKEYLTEIEVNFNTLRQYSKKGNTYKGYFLRAEKIYKQNKNNV
jgi:hypothetical protein